MDKKKKKIDQAEIEFLKEGLIYMTETERLKRDMYRPDMEKLQLFTKMLRTNKLLKKAIIHHK